MNDLFIFIEGVDDKRFVEWVLIDFFNENKSIILHPIPYQNKPPIKTIKKIKQISASENEDYIFLSDLDSHSYECITSRKNKRIKEFHKKSYSDLDSKKIFIVIEEIESWYISGINTELSQFKDLTIPENTDEFTKEQLNELIENSDFPNRISFLMEIVKNYDLSLAIKRNTSFEYFIKKLGMINYI